MYVLFVLHKNDGSQFKVCMALSEVTPPKSSRHFESVVMLPDHLVHGHNSVLSGSQDIDCQVKEHLCELT